MEGRQSDWYTISSPMRLRLGELKRSSEKRMQYFNYNMAPLDNVQWTIPSLLYHTKRKNPFGYKGLMTKAHIHQHKMQSVGI